MMGLTGSLMMDAVCVHVSSAKGIPPRLSLKIPFLDKACCCVTLLERLVTFQKSHWEGALRI